MRRRDFLKTSAAALAVTPLPALGDAVRRYRIEAGTASVRLGEEGAAKTDLWLYNGTSPGPSITALRGEMLEVEFTNRLEVPTTMHWHGIRNLNEMDGVPDLTQAAIEPGESFIYRFLLKDAGTFWYHAHSKGWEQLARGLYGPLVVAETELPDPARDVTLVADDWRLTEDYQLHEASFGSLMDWSHQGRVGNWLTVNGETDPVISVAPGTLRLRVINAANARVLAFRLSADRPMRVVALDGAPCDPFDLQTIRLAPAQRADIMVEMPAGDLRLEDVSTGEPVGAAVLQANDMAPTIASPTTGMAWYQRPDLSGARVIDIHMQGGAMGNLASAEFEGEVLALRDLAQEHSKLWAFNGIVGGYRHQLADLDLGEVTVLRVWNDTRWEHGLHLHGHHFWVDTKEFGEKTLPVLRDTYLMAPGERADLVFVADNPGMWLFHCHTMEHHAAGMGAVISVT
ncbi:MAG: multicopper oxidase family protein [Pseudomonadota bacterium]|nr:multicopper oxidase family protein [Pseudomonadota bacterium]